MTQTTGGFSSAQLADQDAAVELTSFGADDALDLGLLATAKARARSMPVAIEVWRGARLAYRVALPGSTSDNDAWLERKFRVTRRFELSTMAVRVLYEEQGRTFNEATLLPIEEFAAHGGSVPIRVRGTGMVGLFGVSGLPQVQDHDFLVEILSEFKAAQDDTSPDDRTRGA
ncbi:MAG: heme-degrading domain-containing protein [Actinomycetales bacterium]